MTDASGSQRPADDRIPAAVRAVFETNRMKAAWNIASSPTSDSRLAAIEGVCRILDAAGLTLQDVMTAVLSIRPEAQARPGMNDAFAGWSDIFAGMGAARRPASAPDPRPEPAPAARPTGTVRLSGKDIPATIHGRITIEREHKTSRGQMLAFKVEREGYVYGTIVCFHDGGIEKLKAAAGEGAFMAMSVRQPDGEGRNPTATNIRRC